MARWIFVVVVVSGIFGSLQAQTDYCTTSYCKAPRVNVGCNPPPLTGGPSCTGKTPNAIEMTGALKTLILNEHNTRRSQLATGNLAPFAAAKRMPTLSWDTELAKQAGHNARSCNVAHDQCRNTVTYSYAGQNLAMMAFSGMTMTYEQVIKNRIASWWNEKNDTLQAQLDKYPNGYTGPAIGHFTQMASDQTNKIGCALQYWKVNSMETYYLVCDYSVTNIIDRAVYKRGTVGSACNTGINPLFAGLCNESEIINPVPNAA
uniref:Venom allergen-1 n=1 Tax=Anopheles atroparvus TaxID=41427 RepID=A0AAG5D352_ANOAO